MGIKMKPTKHKLSKFQRKKLILKAHRLLDQVDTWLDQISAKLKETRKPVGGE